LFDTLSKLENGFVPYEIMPDQKEFSRNKNLMARVKKFFDGELPFFPGWSGLSLASLQEGRYNIESGHYAVLLFRLSIKQKW